MGSCSRNRFELARAKMQARIASFIIGLLINICQVENSIIKLQSEQQITKMMQRLNMSLKAFVFIQTKKTPNPDFLKFVPGSKIVMGDQPPLDIASQQAAVRKSGLARKLFKVQGVVRVFYGPNYISIAKKPESDWNFIKPMVFDLIQNHFQSGQPLLKQEIQNQQGIDEGDSQTVKLIKQILFSRIRPTVQDDGGDVKFMSFNQETGVLKLMMMGSCVGCPSSSATLKNGILKLLKHYVGQVKDVIAQDYKQK